jgi:excisionase family DNA binding protein
MQLLDDLITIDESAKQLGKSVRSVYRMISRRELAIVYVGKTPLIDVPASRELLKARLIKPLTKQRRK